MSRYNDDDDDYYEQAVPNEDVVDDGGVCVCTCIESESNEKSTLYWLTLFYNGFDIPNRRPP